MKTLNLIGARSLFKRKVGVFLLALTLVGCLLPFKVHAAELNENANPSVIDTVSTANSTTYFINDSRFGFTSSNVGQEFYVPKQCGARLMTAIVADDKVAENITIEVWNTGGFKETSLSIPTNQAKVTTFHIGGGGHYLKYYGRDKVHYNVRLQLYTWDYWSFKKLLTFRF